MTTCPFEEFQELLDLNVCKVMRFKQDNKIKLLYTGSVASCKEYFQELENAELIDILDHNPYDLAGDLCVFSKREIIKEVEHLLLKKIA